MTRSPALAYLNAFTAMGVFTVLGFVALIAAFIAGIGAYLQYASDVPAQLATPEIKRFYADIWVWAAAVCAGAAALTFAIWFWLAAAWNRLRELREAHG